MKNILITSAGKRVVLVELFKKALKACNIKAMVYTTDMNPALAPAGIISDKCFKVPKVTVPEYVDILLSICIDNHIGMVIPTIDTELLILSKNKDKFSDGHISIIVSDTSFIQLCRDKRNTGDFLQKLGIRVPRPIDKLHPIFPLFAKPYDGSLSKDLFVVKNPDELTPEIIHHPKLIFMEYIDKTEYKEFTVDMYYGQDHYVKSIVPRERIEIRAGEINKGYTRKNFLLPYLRERMNYLPGVIGCICIQLFYRESDNDVVGIEINPRFGGGYPLSYYAKADYPQYLIQEYFLDKEIRYSDEWLDNTLMLRYDSEVIVYEKEGSRI